MKDNTLTIAVLSHNTQNSLEDAVGAVVNAVEGKFDDYEIILSDSGSTDRTLEISDRLASMNKKIKVLRLPKVGIGYGYTQALKIAKMKYFTMFPGDNENSQESLEESSKIIGKADIIVPYTLNMHVRKFHRVFISKAFVVLLNFLFGLKLKYYNGTCIYKVKDLKQADIKSVNFAYSAEALLKLLKLGKSYAEIGITIKPSTNTTIFKLNNIIGVAQTLGYLIKEIKFKNKYIVKDINN